MYYQTTKTMTKDELINGLLDWAAEDEDNLSVMIIAGDATGVNVAGNWSEDNDNMLRAMTTAMCTNEYVRDVCAKALELARLQEVTKTIIANDYYDKE